MNSPLRYCDPSGHKSEERLGKGIWSLKSDDLGIMIVSHWLYGGGEDLTIDGIFWLDYEARYTVGDYMMDNKGAPGYGVKPLREQMKDILLPYVESLSYGESIEIDHAQSIIIENGEDIIGYQYLHGTYETVGGFQIQGTISKNSKGDTIYDLTYIWNDIIDPNFIYDSDSKKAEFANSIPGAVPTDYYIQIRWNDKTTIMQNPSFWNRSSGWLSK